MFTSFFFCFAAVLASRGLFHRLRHFHFLRASKLEIVLWLLVLCVCARRCSNFCKNRIFHFNQNCERRRSTIHTRDDHLSPNADGGFQNQIKFQYAAIKKIMIEQLAVAIAQFYYPLVSHNTHTHKPTVNGALWRLGKEELKCNSACRTVSLMFHAARSRAYLFFSCVALHLLIRFCVVFNTGHSAYTPLNFSAIQTQEKLLFALCSLFSTPLLLFGIYKILISKRALARRPADVYDRPVVVAATERNQILIS